MKFDLIVSPEAEADVASAFVWYEERGTGLGVDLVRCVDATIARIHRAPLMFPKKEGEFRQAMTPRFPYAVYFVVNEAQKFISVRAVLHFSQDAPAYLRQRK
jgi:toxin ParE1/3/4